MNDIDSKLDEVLNAIGTEFVDLHAQVDLHNEWIDELAIAANAKLTSQS